MPKADGWTQGRITDVMLQNMRYLDGLLASIDRRDRTILSAEVEKPGREGLLELAAEADVVFFSRSWATVSDPIHLRSCLGC
jgi:ketohexokinase